MSYNKRQFLKLAAGATAAFVLASVSPLASAQEEHATLISYSVIDIGKGRNNPSVAISEFQGRYVASVTTDGETRRYTVQLQGSRQTARQILTGTGQIKIADNLYRSQSQQRGDTIITTLNGTNNSDSGQISTQIVGFDDAMVVGILIVGVVGLAAIAGIALVGGALIDAVSAEGEDGECSVDAREDGGGDGFVAEPYCDEQVPPLNC